MKFWFRGHHHSTEFLFAFKTRLSKWFGSYKWPVTGWFNTHIDDCCDYWEDVGTEKAMRAFVLDGELGLSQQDTSRPLAKKKSSKIATSDPKRKANT